MSTPPVLAKFTNTCKKYEPECIGDTQKVLLYTGMALISVGIAGYSASLSPFLEEQENKSSDQNAAADGNRTVHEENESHDDAAAADGNRTLREQKIEYFYNLPAHVIKKSLTDPAFIFGIIVSVVGAVGLPNIKQWSLRFGIPAICSVVATLVFSSGWCGYKKAKPQGSPTTVVFRVFVAADFKRSRPYPDDDRQLYKGDQNQCQSFSDTNFLRGLHNAALILPEVSLEDQKKNGWRLCSVAEVEDAKAVVRMFPLLSSLIVCGIVSSIGNTYFVEQANNMSNKIGESTYPLQMFLLSFQVGKFVVSGVISVLLSVEGGGKRYRHTPVYGISAAVMYSVLCCIAAAGVETRRLKVIRSHGLLDKPDEVIPMSMFWLHFQFALLACLDAVLGKCLIALYEDEYPPSMRKYFSNFGKAVSGLGYMFSVLTVYAVGKVSEEISKRNWFQFTLNRSRLDRYYWVLATLSAIQFFVFIICWTYRYRKQWGGDDSNVEEESNLSSDESNVSRRS